MWVLDLSPPRPTDQAPLPRRGVGRVKLLKCSRGQTRGGALRNPLPHTLATPPSTGEPLQTEESLAELHPCRVAVAALARGDVGGAGREGAEPPRGFTPSSLGKVAVRSKNLWAVAANGTSAQNHCSALGGQSAGAPHNGSGVCPRCPGDTFPSPPSLLAGQGVRKWEGNPSSPAVGVSVPQFCL